MADQNPWQVVSETPAPSSAPQSATQQTTSATDPWKVVSETPAEPSFWDKTKHAIGQVFSATPEGAGSATSGAGAPELATQFKQDVAASEGPENKLTGAGVIVGGAKSAMEVPQTIGHLVAPNTFSAHPEALQTKGTAETAGKIGENILEFMAGDEALKSLSLGQKYTKLAKIATLLEEHSALAKAVEIGGNAIRTGAVGGTQTLAHGGTLGEAAETGVLAGGTGLALEGLGTGFQALKDMITRNPQIAEQGAALIKGLTEGASQETIAKTVAKNLDTAEQSMYSRYDAGIKGIASNAQKVPVSIAGSPVQMAAKDLLGETSRLPESISESLKGVVPDTEKIEPLLNQLAKSKEVFSWDQIEATRQKIGQLFRDVPYGSPLKRPLNALRSAIDDTMEKAAGDAGNSELSQQIKDVRADYAKNVNALQETAIAALRDKNPNTVADILRNKSSVHNVNTLRSLIGSENMKAVEGSVLDKMVQDASKNGELQGRQLLRNFNSLGPDAKEAIWGDRLPQIKQFMEEAGKLQNPVLQKIVNHYAPLALAGGAVYQLEGGNIKGAAKTGGLVGLGLALKNPAFLDAMIQTMQVGGRVAPAVVAAGAQAGRSSVPGTGDNIIRFTASDGSTHEVHADEIDKARSIDPGLKVIPVQ